MRKALITTGLTAALLAFGAGTADATILIPNGAVVFPPTKAGTMSQKTFTLTREESDGASYANNVFVDDTDDSATFSQTNDCAPFLTPLTPSCTITVTFRAPARNTKAFTYRSRLDAGDGINDSTATLSALAVPAKGKKCKKAKKGASAAKKGCKGKK